jgi:hypothetical protein
LLLKFSLLKAEQRVLNFQDVTPRFNVITIGLCGVGKPLAAVPPTTSSNAGSDNSADGSAFDASSSFLISSLICTPLVTYRSFNLVFVLVVDGFALMGISKHFSCRRRTEGSCTSISHGNG